MARPVVPEATRQRLDATVARLRALLPAGWGVEVTGRSRETGTFSVTSNGDTGTLEVIVRKRLDPRGVPALPDADGPSVVAAPWVSPRTRELLTARGIGFVDDTGNVSVELARPGLVIRIAGSDRDPNPEPTTGPNLRGPRAWALLRTIAEVTPPYGVQQLAGAVGVDTGYVSRVLKVLADELLIEREPRGPVTSVDWEGVLRKLATTYSLFGSNETSTWVASGGPGQLIDDLSTRNVGRWAVTGSFATAALAPVAAPVQAAIYTDDPERLAKAGRLLRATTGANVVLAEPYDDIVFTRTRSAGKVLYVSVAQAAVDALSGPGRMSAEGDALLDWMRRDPRRWKADALTADAAR